MARLFYLRNLLDSEELAKIREDVETNEDIKKYSHGVSADTTNKQVMLCCWNHPGDDVTGMLSRSRKVTLMLKR